MCIGRSAGAMRPAILAPRPRDAYDFATAAQRIVQMLDRLFKEETS